MKSKRKVLVSLIIIYGCCAVTSGQIVATEDGLIEGRVVLTRSGVPFNGFFGIPFAEPPIGALRFRDPVPKTPWDGILNCTAFGPMCMQFGVGIFGSEDCLQLNVFTKNLPTNETRQLKPVIAFIHGGGFTVNIKSCANLIHVFDDQVRAMKSFTDHKMWRWKIFVAFL